MCLYCTIPTPQFLISGLVVHPGPVIFPLLLLYIPFLILSSSKKLSWVVLQLLSQESAASFVA